MPDPTPISDAPKLEGLLTPGNLVVGGSNPNTIKDGGAPSAAGGVGAGTIGQIAQYAATGTAVQGATVSGDATIAAGGALTLAAASGAVKGPTTPASASAAGVTGTVLWDSGFIYVCVTTNTWKRVAIATW
jgi:hypothetical protein